MAFPELDPNQIFRDFTTHGVPASGKWDPRKAEIRRLLKDHESTIIALIGGQGGDISLARGVVYFSVTGGTENDLIAEPDADLPDVAGSAVYIIGGIASDNTGPVTINSKPLLTNSGNQIAAGGLVAGGIYLFLDAGDSYRLLSDQVSAAIQAAAEAAQVAAEVARDDAEVSRSAAAASAIEAASSASGASGSEAAALSSRNAAVASAAAAEGSASGAASSETAAANSEQAASSSASGAATSASNAASSESAAGTHASNAGTSATAAANSAAAAAISADEARDAAASVGNPVSIDPQELTEPQKAQARQNIGLGNSATRDVGTTAGTVPAGDDGRFSDARDWTASVVTQAEAEAGTATTARKWTAQRVRQNVDAAKSTAKAWVNFNGTGTVAIRDSYNISSITDNGVGDYSVNFLTPMTNANYATLVTVQHSVASSWMAVGNIKPGSMPTTGRVTVKAQDSTALGVDMPMICVAVFGG